MRSFISYMPYLFYLDSIVPLYLILLSHSHNISFCFKYFIKLNFDAQLPGNIFDKM